MSTRMTIVSDAVEVEENEYDEIKKYLHSARETMMMGLRQQNERGSMRVCKKRKFLHNRKLSRFFTLFLFHAIVNDFFLRRSMHVRSYNF